MSEQIVLHILDTMVATAIVTLLAAVIVSRAKDRG